VKFCYCPKCDKLQARNWYTRSRCEICNEKCVVFSVNRTVFGWLMYILDVIAVVLIVLYLVDYDQIVAAMTQLGAQVAIFGLIIVSFAMAFIDISKTTRRAEEMVRSGRISPPPSNP
jgi:hypothetical protein